MPPKRSNPSQGPEIRVVIENPAASGRRAPTKKKAASPKRESSTLKQGSDFQIVRLGKKFGGAGSDAFRVDGIGDKPDPKRGIRITHIPVRPSGGGPPRDRYTVYRDGGLFGEKIVGVYYSLKEAGDVALSQARIDARAESKVEGAQSSIAGEQPPRPPPPQSQPQTARSQPNPRLDLDGDGEVEPDEEKIASAKDAVSIANSKRLDLNVPRRDPDLRTANKEWTTSSEDLADAVSDYQKNRQREDADARFAARAIAFRRRLTSVKQAPGRGVGALVKKGRGGIRY